MLELALPNETLDVRAAHKVLRAHNQLENTCFRHQLAHIPETADSNEWLLGREHVLEMANAKDCESRMMQHDHMLSPATNSHQVDTQSSLVCHDVDAVCVVKIALRNNRLEPGESPLQTERIHTSCGLKLVEMSSGRTVLPVSQRKFCIHLTRSILQSKCGT